jgi:hypothetical protein
MLLATVLSQYQDLCCIEGTRITSFRNRPHIHVADFFGRSLDSRQLMILLPAWSVAQLGLKRVSICVVALVLIDFFLQYIMA